VSGGGSGASPIARLEKELRDIWTVPNEPGTAPMSRVITMNLEVVAGTRDLLDRYTPVVDEVTASIPARAILASVEPDASPDGLEGEATAVCSNEGGRKVCSERIVLRARGGAAQRSASAIESFLVPEIPTALVWLGRVYVDDPVFQDLANDAQRILLDSEYSSIASVIHVAQWARRRNGPAVSDLAWTRLASWHEMLARFFDETHVRALTSKVVKLRLVQASDPGARLGPEASLMFGWIATRLGWTTSHVGGALRFKRPDGGSVQVELRAVPRPEGVAPLTLAALGIEAVDGDLSLRGTIERELGSGTSSAGGTPDSDVVVWRREISGGPMIEQRARLGANKAAKWLERTLHRQPHDPAFTESIAFAEQIVDDGLTVS
jgi:glucose-6-phosphate dehydrogenase assembly protein OpcA